MEPSGAVVRRSFVWLTGIALTFPIASEEERKALPVNRFRFNVQAQVGEKPDAAGPRVDEALRLWRNPHQAPREKAKAILEQTGPAAFPELVQQTQSKDPVTAQQARQLLAALGWPSGKLVEPVKAWPPQEAARFWGVLLEHADRQGAAVPRSGGEGGRRAGHGTPVFADGLQEAAFEAIQALAKLDPGLASREIRIRLPRAEGGRPYFLLRALAVIDDPEARAALKQTAAGAAERPETLEPQALVASALLARRGEEALYRTLRERTRMKLQDGSLQPKPATELGSGLYNQACYESLAGRKEESFRLLARAVQEGFLDVHWMWTDPDLYELRGDPRFVKFLGSLEGDPASAEHAPPIPEQAEKLPETLTTAVRWFVGSTPDFEERVGDMVAQMGADDFQTREEAMKRIRFEFGPAALPHLRKAAEGGDAEVASRARKVVESIQHSLAGFEQAHQAFQQRRIQRLHQEFQAEIQRRQIQLQKLQKLQQEIQSLQGQLAQARQQADNLERQARHLEELRKQQEQSALQLQQEIQKRELQLRDLRQDRR